MSCKSCGQGGIVAYFSKEWIWCKAKIMNVKSMHIWWNIMTPNSHFICSNVVTEWTEVKHHNMLNVTGMLVHMNSGKTVFIMDVAFWPCNALHGQNETSIMKTVCQQHSKQHNDHYSAHIQLLGSAQMLLHATLTAEGYSLWISGKNRSFVGTSPWLFWLILELLCRDCGMDKWLQQHTFFYQINHPCHNYNNVL